MDTGHVNSLRSPVLERKANPKSPQFLPPPSNAVRDRAAPLPARAVRIPRGGTFRGRGGRREAGRKPTAGNLPPDTLLKCNRDRTAWEDSTIVNARAHYRRANFGSDTVAARECADLNERLTEALADVVNGKQTLRTGVDDTGDKPHWGLGTTGAGHVDPRTYLAIQNNPGSAAAWRQLMSTLLHEAAHWHGAPGHPNYQSGSPTYTDPLYKRLMPANLNSDTCLK